jgi:hypothetical protein
MSAAATEPTITRTDLESKFRELRGGVDDTAQSVKGYAVAAGAVLVVGIVAVAFVLGRRRGTKRSTIVEVRRL